MRLTAITHGTNFNGYMCKIIQIYIKKTGKIRDNFLK